MPPSARIGDMHVCPMVTPGTPPVPHVGGPISVGCPTVMIGFMPAARVGDMAICVGPPDAIALGSMGVIIGGMAAARIGDMTVHGGTIAMGFPTVMIGDLFVPDLQAIVDAVNPAGSVVNCGNIVDAVIGRLTGTDPNATSPADRDGSFDAIAARHGTAFTWGQSFQGAFDAVQRGGDGTTALVGIGYSSGTASHIVVMTNRNGRVAILEGQDWGAGNPREVITNPGRANQRYNSDGGSSIGVAVLPGHPGAGR